MKVRELELRYGTDAGDIGDVVDTAVGAVSFLRGWIGACTEERFVALLLDARNRPIGVTRISQGTLTASLVHPREAFKAAVVANANAMLIAHNHPSGDARPSKEDIDVTKRLVTAGKLLGICVLDHLVICADSHTSLREESPELF